MILIIILYNIRFIAEFEIYPVKIQVYPKKNTQLFETLLVINFLNRLVIYF